nr:uncharacterized protein LOC124496182 [Dermatophagoides farinae]
MSTSNKSSDRRQAKNKLTANHAHSNARVSIASPSISHASADEVTIVDDDQPMSHIEIPTTSDQQHLTLGQPPTSLFQSVTQPVITNISQPSSSQQMTTNYTASTSQLQQQNPVTTYSQPMTTTHTFQQPLLPPHSQFLYQYGQPAQPQFSNTSVPTSFNPGLFYSQNAAATSAAPASFNFLPPTTNIATTATTTPITTSISRSATPVNNMPSANNNVEFLKETLKMASKLGGNITTARKEAVVDALNLALSLSQENNVLKEQLTNAYKRRRTDTDLCSRDDPMDDDDSNYVTKAELKSYLDDIKNSINNLSNIISKQSNKATSNKQNPPLTFAEIIKENKKSSTPKHQTVVFLPDNEDTLVTRQTLSKLIHPAKEGIAMTDAKSLSKGKMIINFKDKASKSKFESLAKATKKINTEPPRKLRPSIMLKGVRIEVKKEDIPSMFAAFNYPIAYYVETNKLDITKLMEVVSDRKNFRSEYLINYVISIDPAIRDLVINEMNGKVILDYALVHAEDMSPLRQCYRCYGFNHIANTCQLPPEQQICHHCALTHKYELCPNKACAPRCVNCRKTGIKVDTNHNSTNKSCPVYIRMLQRMADKVEYYNNE